MSRDLASSARTNVQDFDPVEDPLRLAKVLRRGWREGAPGVFDGFRYGCVSVAMDGGY